MIKPSKIQFQFPLAWSTKNRYKCKNPRIIVSDFYFYVSTSVISVRVWQGLTVLQSKAMSHLYIFFTLEIVPLDLGKAYGDLPSHLTLMSRFLSDLAPEELSSVVKPLFADNESVNLVFGNTIELGPKKVVARTVNSPDEQSLHERLQIALEKTGVTFQYSQFIGPNHKAHVTQRDGVDFPLKNTSAYLIEVIDGQRIIRSRFNLSKAPVAGYSV